MKLLKLIQVYVVERGVFPRRVARTLDPFNSIGALSYPEALPSIEPTGLAAHLRPRFTVPPRQ